MPTSPPLCLKIQTLSHCLEIGTLWRCLKIQTSVFCPEMKTQPEVFRIYTPASIGAAIRHFRLKHGLSQDELAHKTNLHRSYLSAIEKGRDTEHVRRLFRILKQLGLRMNLEQASW